MQFHRPAPYILLAALLSGSTPAAAQVRTAPDYATDAFADPWDFEQATDYVYMFSEDPSNPNRSSWASIPTIANGHFIGRSQVANPQIQLLFEGIMGGLNVVGRTGVHFPIDTTRYQRLSFRVRRSAMPPSGSTELIRVSWFKEPTRGRGTGFITALVRGFNQDLRAWANTSPEAQQGDTNRWHIYKIDLDRTHPAFFAGEPWTGVVRGLRLQFGESPSLNGATIDLDWVRLTQRGTALQGLDFSGAAGRVTVTARNRETNDIVQVYPDQMVPEAPEGTTFAPGRYVWDYGFLPPGPWEITATSGSWSSVVTLVIDPPPVIQVMEPDAAGGRDYASSAIGDAWDLTNAADVQRDGQLNQVTNVNYGPGGLTATSTGNDPSVALLDDSLRRPGTERTLDASVYRHLTFTLDYDRKDLSFLQALGPEYGGVARVLWRGAGHNGGAITNTQDIFVLDGGPQTYSMDLGSFAQFGDCATCQLEAESFTGRDLWQGQIGVLRIDPYESQASRSFRLADVRVAADDEPTSTGVFTIRWKAFDATWSREIAGTGASDATVRLFYNDRPDATRGLLIADNIPATAGAYSWNVAALQPGRYYVYAEIRDAAGNVHGNQSGGPVATTGRYLTYSAWAAQYSITDANGDPDQDGVTNQQEYQSGTNPLLSNTWLLPEGASGFFVERIALANPDPADANVTLTFLRKEGDPITRDYTVAGNSRLTVTTNNIAGLEQAEFSTVVTARTGGVVAERTMFWGDDRYGGHGGKAVQGARTRWYFAEGDAGFFDTWVLLANATSQAAQVKITFLLPGGGTVVRTYTVNANSRLTVFANDIAELKGRSFSGDISSDVPITVERAMYFSSQGRFWNGGHVAAAVEGPAPEWFVAEGRTGEFFDEYLLLANPNPTPGTATVRYLMQGGRYFDQDYPLPPNSRTTLYVDQELANRGYTEEDVSARITATVPIIVERAMYWPGNMTQWYEAHASAGVTSTGTKWVLAEGEQGGSYVFDTYILFANPSESAATVRVRPLKTNGAGTDVTFTMPPNSRVTKNAMEVGIGPGEQFGVLIDSMNGVPIVVERAMYWNGGGQFWGGGTNETGTKLR